MPAGRIASFAAAVLAVLAIAAAALVLRGALQSDPAPVAAAPPAGATSASPPASTFDPAAAQTRAVPRSAALIATAKRPRITVYPGARLRHGRVLHRRVFHGQVIPLTFLVTDRRKGWVRVELPTRPNLATAWVRRRDVRYSFTRLRVRIALRRHRLEVFDGTRLALSAAIGVGRSVSPTPRGRYFITDVVRTGQPDGFYGPYALGLSAHSTVYTSFEGGNGQVGIHGTNLPSALGSDVSHGCIRVRNTVIRRMARLLPLGTPVTIA